MATPVAEVVAKASIPRPLSVSTDKIAQLSDIANNIRIHAIRATTAAGSGHPTSALSIAEIMSVLFFDSMAFDPADFANPAADRFVLSKGHACSALYGALVEAGCYPASELDKFRTLDSAFEGNLMPSLKEIDVATGSLGNGLCHATGMAYVGRYTDFAPYYVFCIIGDGESQEGSIWEALAFGSYYNLTNLIPIFDINRLAESAPTMLEHDLEAYSDRLEAFGWKATIVDGHDVAALVRAIRDARQNERTTCILAKTYKGHLVEEAENKENWHGKALTKEEAEKATETIQSQLNIPKRGTAASHDIVPTLPPLLNISPPVDFSKLHLNTPPLYTLGERFPTCDAFGNALVKLGSMTNRMLVFDGDVKQTTRTNWFEQKNPHQFVECFIAEQNMIGVATGAACRDRTVVFACTYASFLTRAFDQLRVACISRSNLNVCGGLGGVSMSLDSACQMGLEDFAMMRSLPSCTIFYPSDAVATERAVELAVQTKGMTYIRTTQLSLPIVYSKDEEFKIGQAKIVHEISEGKSPDCVIIGAGVTLREAKKAAVELAKYNVTVIDPFTIKPIDAKTIGEAVKAADGRLVIVEDHYAHGGIGDAVLNGLMFDLDPPVAIKSLRHLALREVPHCGPEEAILSRYKLDAMAIAAAVREICGPIR